MSPQLLSQLQSLLNTPLEKWPFKIRAASTNSSGRVNSAIISIGRTRIHVSRCYNGNGSCYFKAEQLQ